MGEPSSRRYDGGHDSYIDDSGVPSYLLSWYKAVMRYPKPLLLSAEQVMFGAHGYYIFWEFRRLLIERLQPDLEEELAFLERLIRYDSRDLLKWVQRRWMAQKFGSNAASKELEFTRKIIHEDVNNSFAWSHRQWCFLALGGNWEDELTFCAKILEQDIFNSYAWDQRYFVVSRAPSLGGLMAMRDKEVDYALQAIALEPSNEHPWRYLRLLYKGDLQSIIENRQLENTCVSVFKKEKEKSEGVLFNAFMDDLMDKKGGVNALEMVLDLVRLGFKPRKETIDAIRALCRSDSGFLAKARSILQSAISDV